MPRFFFDVHTSDGLVERDATGVVAPEVGSVLYGCIGAILEMIDDCEENVESITVRSAAGDTLLAVNFRALRELAAQAP